MGKRGRPAHPSILTPREWEVLGLLREHLTNEQIANRLGISLDGAKYHVSSILSKLGASTREEAAAWRETNVRPWWKRLIAAPAAILGATTLVATTGGMALLAWGILEMSGPEQELAGPVAAAEEGSIERAMTPEEASEAETLLEALSAGARNSSAANPRQRQCPDETLTSSNDDTRSLPPVQSQLLCTPIGPAPLPVGPMLTPAGPTPTPTARRPRAATGSSPTPTPAPNPSPSPAAQGPVMYLDADPTWDTASCVETTPGSTLQLQVSVAGAPPYDDGGTPDYWEDDSGGVTSYFYEMSLDPAHFSIRGVPLGGPLFGPMWMTDDGILHSTNYASIDVDGVLDVLTIDLHPDTRPGEHHLTLISGVIDGWADYDAQADEPSEWDSDPDLFWNPVLTHATIAVGVDCPSLPKPADPTPFFCKVCGEAISVDADPAHNTATSLGMQNDCIETTPSAIIEIDVTALNIPPYADYGRRPNRPDLKGGITAFAYTLLYDETNLSVQSQSSHFLLTASPSSSLFNASDGMPDSDGSNSFASAVLDMSGGAPESGSGVLDRLTISVDPAATLGLYDLTIVPDSAVHLDAKGEAYHPHAINNATLAVGMPCL
jgi:DNA-binding CsgD family transcriptional regulator